MYFIEDEEELIGKEIIYADFATFGEYITIGTKDGGILCFQQDQDSEIIILPQALCKRYMYSDKYLINDLHKLGLITDAEVKECEDYTKARKKQIEEENRKYEYKQYLRLKEKYEGEK